MSQAAFSVKSTCTASKGNSTRPVSVFCRMPVFNSAFTSPWTAFTSRPSLRRGLTNRHRSSPGHELKQLPALACEDLEKKRRRVEAYKGPLRVSLKCLKEPPVSFFPRRYYQCKLTHLRASIVYVVPETVPCFDSGKAFIQAFLSSPLPELGYRTSGPDGTAPRNALPL